MAIPDIQKLNEVVKEIRDHSQGNTSVNQDIKDSENKETPPQPDNSVSSNSSSSSNSNPADQPPTPVSLDDLPEDEFLKQIEKRGLKIQKETLTEDQRKKQEEIEEVEKLRFAVENSQITAERYNELKSILQEEGGELTKRQFSKAWKSENPSATKEEVEELYNDYYFINNQKPVAEGEDPEPLKYNERQVKLGQSRFKTDEQSLKNSAKAILDNIDINYKNFKSFQTKASDYTKTVGEFVKETNFEEYPISYQINKEKNISAKVNLGKEAGNEVADYLINKVGHIMLQSENPSDKAEIKRLADSYIRDKKSENIVSTLWELAKSEGINEGKVGASTPLEKIPVGGDNTQKEVTEIQNKLSGIPQGLINQKRTKT